MRKGRFIPLIMLVILAAGCVIYALNGMNRLFGIRFIYITIFICYMVTLTLESCIQSGLILTNNGYDELFKFSSIKAVITDKEFSPLISSDSYKELPPEQLKTAQTAPTEISHGIRLSCAEIKQGHVLWQDDLSELKAILTELSAANDYLRDKNDAEKKAYEYQKKERQLIEQNRLYNRILTQTQSEIELYAKLVEELEKETDPEKVKLLTLKTAFVCAFIKRRDNLIFLCEESDLIRPLELCYGVEESLSNLRLGGVECSCSFDMEKPIAFEKISALYENFYKLLFSLIGILSSVCVYLFETDGKPVVVMRICCIESIDLTDREQEGIRLEKEENEWTVTIS